MSDAPAYRSLLPAQLRDAEPGFGTGELAPRDRRDGAVYLLDEDLRLAVDVALATSRPLLLRGEPGSGKSSLAAYVARNLGWRYYEHVVTSRTRARDLLWTFDSVRKLADASMSNAGSAALRDYDYVEPGVLWWAMDPESAHRRGVPQGALHPRTPADEPGAEINAGRDRAGAVVLLDEIDKADPDVPNGLLVPLGSAEFQITEIGRQVPEKDTLVARIFVLITTNAERELPPAFLRRCISHRLPEPTREWLIAVGRRHVPASPFLADRVEDSLLVELAREVEDLRKQAAKRAHRKPSTAEYLDAVWACASLGVDAEHPDFKRVCRLVLSKDPAAGERA